MKFNLKDFLELDTKSLLAVNGGTDCSGSSSPSSPSNSDGGGSGGPGSSTTSSYGSGSGGGGCSNTPSKPTTPTTPKSDGSNSSTSSGGGGCSGITSTPPTTNDTNGDSKDASSDNIKSQTERPNDDGTKTLITVYDDGKTTAITYDSDGNSVLDQTYYPTDTKGSTPEQDSTRDSEKTTISDTTTETTGENISGYTGESSGSGQLDYNDNGHNSSSSNPSTANNEEENLSTQTPEVKIVATGTFGQITDGSYADELTMQKYKNEPYKYQQGLDEKMNGEGNSFSKQGCKMTAAAKIASEVSGNDIDIFVDINQKWDNNDDGLLGKDEICSGLQLLLGDDYIISGEKILSKDLSLDKLKSYVNSEDTTYVLAEVNLGDVTRDGLDDTHWIVVEGFSKDSTGKITFTYDGTSDNDVGRTYVLGDDPNPLTKTASIVGLECYTINKKI